MSNYKGHLVGGTVAFGVLYWVCQKTYAPSIAVTAEWFMCTLAGALFPDIDIKSKGQKYFYWIIVVCFSIMLVKQHYEYLAYGSIITVFPMLVRHRGIFHRYWFIVFLVLCAWYFFSAVYPVFTHIFFIDALFFVAGAFSHIILDYGMIKTINQLFLRRSRRNNNRRFYRR